MNGYLALARHQQTPRRHLHLVGADGITDKATVKSVQAQLQLLAKATGNVALDPTRGNPPGKIDGIIGPRTQAAVFAFNAAYGWPTDGNAITQGTMEALARPDVVKLTQGGGGSSSAVSFDDAQGKAAAVADANLAAAKAQQAADAAKAVAAASPAAAQAAATAQQAADSAKAAAAQAAAAPTASAATVALNVVQEATKTAANATQNAAGLAPPSSASTAAIDAAEAAHIAATRKKGAHALATLLIAGTIGGLLGGGLCAWAWPAHRILAFLIGSILIGSPVGYGVGAALVAEEIA